MTDINTFIRSIDFDIMENYDKLNKIKTPQHQITYPYNILETHIQPTYKEMNIIIKAKKKGGLNTINGGVGGVDVFLY